jgi:hypothetical protein
LGVMVHATDIRIDPLTYPQSVMAMARGYATVADPYGASALTLNPAGLAESGRGLQVHQLANNHSQIINQPGYFYYRPGWSVGYWSEQTTSHTLDVSAVGLGHRSQKGLHWGIAYRWYTTPSGNGLNGSAADIGVLVPLHRYLNMGMVVKNSLWWGDSVSPKTVLGIAARLPQPRVTLTVDAVDVAASHRGYVCWGLRTDIASDFSLQLGMYPQHYTGGVAMQLKTITIEYAMVGDDTGFLHAAFGLRLGQRRLTAASLR